MNWEELGNKIFEKIDLNIGGIKKRPFLKWWMIREKLDLSFDYKLVARMYLICKRDLYKDGDHFMVVTGGEGKGKSTLAMNMCAWADPDFSLDDIPYSIRGYMEIVKDRLQRFAKGEVLPPKSILLDEAALELFSREAMSESNKALAKLFMVQRCIHIFVCLCIPNFYFLDTMVKQHRVNTIVHCLDRRGDYKAIVGDGMIKANTDAQKVQKQINKVKLQLEHFWTGSFKKYLPETIDVNEYKRRKVANILEFVNDIEESIVDPKFVAMHMVVKRTGISRKVFLGDPDKYQIKKIGKYFYMPTELANSLG